MKIEISDNKKCVLHLTLAATARVAIAPAALAATVSPALTGETLDLPEDATATPEAYAAPAPADPRASPAARVPGGPKKPARARYASTVSAPYGAVGERTALDLASAFTRAFPQAASADPGWLRAPFGPLGGIEVTLEIDPRGFLVRAHVDGGAPPALRRGVERTLALIRARPFTARAATTRIHLDATVSPDQVHDGLHGDVFAIGGSFDGGQGNAFFALAVGRRIDLAVRAFP